MILDVDVLHAGVIDILPHQDIGALIVAMVEHQSLDEGFELLKEHAEPDGYLHGARSGYVFCFCS